MENAFDYKDNEIFAYPDRVNVPGLENIAKDFKHSEWIIIRFNNVTKDFDLKECLKSIDIEEKAKYDEYVKTYPYWSLPPKDKNGFYNRNEWLALPENKHLKEEREKQIRERKQARHEYKKKHKDCTPEERKKLHVDRVYEERKIRAEKLLKHRPCSPDPYIEPAYDLTDYEFPKYTVQVNMPIEVVKAAQHIIEIFEINKSENPKNIAPVEVYYNTDTEVTRVYTEYHICLICIWMFLDYYYIENEKLTNYNADNTMPPELNDQNKKDQNQSTKDTSTDVQTAGNKDNISVDRDVTKTNDSTSVKLDNQVKLKESTTCKQSEDEEDPESRFIILKTHTFNDDPLPNQLIRSADAIFAEFVKMRYDWYVLDKVSGYLDIPWLKELSECAQEYFIRNLKDRVRFVRYFENADGAQSSIDNDGWDLNNRDHLRILTREHAVHRFDDPASQLIYNDRYDIVKWDDESESTWSDSVSSDLTESSDEECNDEDVMEMVGKKQTAAEIIDD